MKGTLKVFADDWETAVGAQEKDANFKAKSEIYLQKNFYLANGKKKIVPVVLGSKSINTHAPNRSFFANKVRFLI